jgi:hypothetical protein
VISYKKDKVVPVLNKLSTTPSRRMGEWRYHCHEYNPGLSVPPIAVSTENLNVRTHERRVS